MSKPSKEINMKIPTVEEIQLMSATVESDPHALPLTDEQMERNVPMRVLRGRVGNRQMSSNWFQSDIVLRSLTISDLLELTGKPVWLVCLRNG